MADKQNVLLKLEPILQVPEIVKPRDVLYRYDSVASRYYFRFPPAGDEMVYMGATAAVDILVRKGRGIYGWYAQNGEMAYLLLKTLADYGTLMHIQIAEFEKAGRHVKWAELGKQAFDSAMMKGFAFAADEWAYLLPRNIASWIQFCSEKEVKVLGIEFPVWSDKLRIATLIDVYCELTFNKKRIKAIINLKSNYSGEEDETKTFYESSDCQLQIEKRLWEECVPDLPVEMVFNWSPNNWKDEPTYTFKNWTDKTSWPKERLDDSLPLLKWEFKPLAKVVTLIGEYGPGKDLKSCLKAVRMNEDKLNG